MHARVKIRNKLKEILKGLPTTGNNVFGADVFAIGTKSLPALFILTGAEEATPTTVGRPRRMERILTIAIIGVAEEGTEDCEDLLDRIAFEVEGAITSNTNLGGLVKSITLNSTQSAFEAQSTAGRIQMNYTITYYTQEGKPDITL